MKALRAPRPGGPESLLLDEVPSPVPGPDQILVRVKAAAMNRADILQRRGHYPPPPGVTDILGMEMAGVVEAVGARVTRWKPGDKVFGLMPGGACAELAVVHERMAVALPSFLSFEQAASLPEVFLTAYNALVWLGGLAPGGTALVHAGASGLGTAAIQIVKRRGGKVFVTAGSAAKAEVCRGLGADGVALYKEEDFSAKVLEWTGGRGVDVLVDTAGAPAFERNMKSIAIEGRWIVLGFLGGPKGAPLNLADILWKRIRIEGSTLRARPLEYEVKLTHEFFDWALPLFADGRLKPVIDRVFPWEQAGDAHRRMDENLNVGKIVLKVG